MTNKEKTKLTKDRDVKLKTKLTKDRDVKLKNFTRVACAATLLLCAYIFWAAPTSRSTPPAAGITATGTGSVEVMANVVFVDLAIVTDHESATQALSSNNKQMTQVFKTLEKNNILKAGADTDESVGHFQTKRFQVTRKYKLWICYYSA